VCLRYVHGAMVHIGSAHMDAAAEVGVTPQAGHGDGRRAGRQAAQGKWRRLQVDDAAVATLAGMGFKPALVRARRETAPCRACV
jgi:hypothetical protein